LRVGKEKQWREDKRAWTAEEARYQQLVDLHVGVAHRDAISNQSVLTKMEVRRRLFKEKGEIGRTVFITTGSFQNLVTTVLRDRDEKPDNPLVIIFSDWEEKTLEMSKTMVAFKQVARRMNAPFVIVMASQDHLEEPWLSWVGKVSWAGGSRSLPVFREYTPALLQEFYRKPGVMLNPKRYTLFSPSAYPPLEHWESNIFRLVTSLSWSLLCRGGCLIVKVVSKRHCFRLAKGFDRYQEALINDGLLLREKRIRCVPYCSTMSSLPRLDGGATVLFCTDIISYGHNLPNCRGVVSCGLRKCLQYVKAFGLTVLVTKVMTPAALFQLCGRIDRAKIEKGCAFTLVPMTSPLRQDRHDILVSSDESFLLTQILEYVEKAEDMQKVVKLSTQDLVQSEVASQTEYSLNLLNINYPLTVQGPGEVRDLRDLLHVITVKLGSGRPRWKFALLQLWLLHQNKIIGFDEEDFVKSLLIMLKYVAFVEDCSDWVSSEEEVSWADYDSPVTGDTSKTRLLAQLKHEWRRNEDECGGYGGEGCQSLLWFHKVVEISLQPELNAVGWGNRYKKFRGVLVMPVVNRLVLDIGNLAQHFVNTRFRSKVILRNHFRLLSVHRWEEASDQERVQLVLCNTRPLQVATFMEMNSGSLPNYARTIVNKQVVYFNDAKLRWNPDTKLTTPSCQCSVEERKWKRYIYFGKVNMKKMPNTKFGDLFEVRETMPIAHAIGCALEWWFVRTQAHLNNRSVITEITTEECKSSGVDIALLHQAHANSFEEEYDPC